MLQKLFELLIDFNILTQILFASNMLIILAGHHRVGVSSVNRIVLDVGLLTKFLETRIGCIYKVVDHPWYYLLQLRLNLSYSWLVRKHHNSRFVAIVCIFKLCIHYGCLVRRLDRCGYLVLQGLALIKHALTITILWVQSRELRTKRTLIFRAFFVILLVSGFVRYHTFSLVFYLQWSGDY